MRRIYLLAVIALAACAPRYEASDTVTLVPAPAGAEVVGQQVLTVRAFYAPDISLAELGDAVCTVNAGAGSVQVTTPAKVSVPKRLDALQDLVATCKARIGPRIAEATARVEAMELNPERVERMRQYPSTLDARF